MTLVEQHCPVCFIHYAIPRAIRRHMKTKHAGFVAEPIDGAEKAA